MNGIATAASIGSMHECAVASNRTFMQCRKCGVPFDQDVRHCFAERPLFNHHLRCHNLTLAILGHLASKCHRLLGAHILGGGSHIESKFPRLSDKTHAYIIERE